MATATVRIGPADHGRRMRLADFEFAEVQEGYRYELGRGVIVVSDVPNQRHLAQVTVIRDQLILYRHAHPGTIYSVAAGGECKVLAPAFESERHPDLAVYKTPPPGNSAETWRTWVPEIVIEVLSPGATNQRRDREVKLGLYSRREVPEYWITDWQRRELLVYRRKGETLVLAATLRGDDVLTSPLLPGFSAPVSRFFANLPL